MTLRSSSSRKRRTWPHRGRFRTSGGSERLRWLVLCSQRGKRKEKQEIVIDWIINLFRKSAPNGENLAFCWQFPESPFKTFFLSPKCLQNLFCVNAFWPNMDVTTSTSPTKLLRANNATALVAGDKFTESRGKSNWICNYVLQLSSSRRGQLSENSKQTIVRKLIELKNIN